MEITNLLMKMNKEGSMYKGMLEMNLDMNKGDGEKDGDNEYVIDT